MQTHTHSNTHTYNNTHRPPHRCTNTHPKRDKQGIPLSLRDEDVACQIRETNGPMHTLQITTYTYTNTHTLTHTHTLPQTHTVVSPVEILPFTSDRPEHRGISLRRSEDNIKTRKQPLHTLQHTACSPSQTCSTLHTHSVHAPTQHRRIKHKYINAQMHTPVYTHIHTSSRSCTHTHQQTHTLTPMHVYTNTHTRTTFGINLHPHIKANADESLLSCTLMFSL